MSVGTGLSLAAALLALTGCGGSPPAPQQLKVQVSTQPVALGRFSNDVDTISTLEAIEEVQLAAQTNGRI